jgi:hypothetical protein
MVPAGQGLNARDLPGAGGQYGLVGERDFSAVEGSAQVSLQLATVLSGAVHLSAEEADDPASLLFGAIKSQIGTLAQFLGRVGIAGCKRDADAASQLDRPLAVETAARSIAMLNIEPGATVVVNGATGGVGSAAVQLLGMQGMTVIGTTSPPNFDYLASLGAAPVAYGDGVAGRIRATAPQGVDAVLDLVGHDFAAIAIALTGNPQRVITTADFAAAKLGIKPSTGSPDPSAASVTPILPLAATGAFRTEIASIFTLPDLRAAHEMVETGHVRGKVIITNEEKIA